MVWNTFGIAGIEEEKWENMRNAEISGLTESWLERKGKERMKIVRMNFAGTSSYSAWLRLDSFPS